MVAYAAGAGRTAQRQVEVAEGEEEPAENPVGECPQRSPGQPCLDVFEHEDEEGGRGSGAPAGGHDLKGAGEISEAVEGPAAVAQEYRGRPRATDSNQPVHLTLWECVRSAQRDVKLLLHVLDSAERSMLRVKSQRDPACVHVN